MASDKHTQKAGDNSQQNQANTINVYNGIDEARVRVIFNECMETAIKNYSQESDAIIQDRLNQFRGRLIPRISKIEKGLEAFADPSFQKLLWQAQVAAAATEREEDYSMLTELLACRVEKGEQRTIRAAIHGAVKIIDEIDSVALNGLTILFLLVYYQSESPSCKEGLQAINQTISCFDLDKLTELNPRWLDHLQCLQTISVTSISSILKLESFYAKRYNGYATAGIKVNSEDHTKAREILKAAGLSSKLLVRNEIMPEYMRLGFFCREEIQQDTSIWFNKVHGKDGYVMNDTYRKAFEDIWDLYDTDKKVSEMVKDAFIREIDSYDSLRRVRAWWNGITGGLDLTIIGIVLAYTNAKRINPKLPEMDLLK